MLFNLTISYYLRCRFSARARVTGTLHAEQKILPSIIFSGRRWRETIFINEINGRKIAPGEIQARVVETRQPLMPIWESPYRLEALFIWVCCVYYLTSQKKYWLAR